MCIASMQAKKCFAKSASKLAAMAPLVCKPGEHGLAWRPYNRKMLEPMTKTAQNHVWSALVGIQKWSTCSNQQTGFLHDARAACLFLGMNIPSTVHDHVLKLCHFQSDDLSA
jgi:hypothetical protein